MYSVDSPKKPLTSVDYDDVTDFNNGRAFVSVFGEPIINPNSTLVANGVPYKLLPGQKKSWQFNRKTRISFTCEFEPIPKITTDIDFIETPSSSFNIKGIKINSNAGFPNFFFSCRRYSQLSE